MFLRHRKLRLTSGAAAKGGTEVKGLTGAIGLRTAASTSSPTSPAISLNAHGAIVDDGHCCRLGHNVRSTP
jgi:hypothetical protein